MVSKDGPLKSGPPTSDSDAGACTCDVSGFPRQDWPIDNLLQKNKVHKLEACERVRRGKDCCVGPPIVDPVVLHIFRLPGLLAFCPPCHPSVTHVTPKTLPKWYPRFPEFYSTLTRFAWPSLSQVR